MVMIWFEWVEGQGNERKERREERWGGGGAGRRETGLRVGRFVFFLSLFWFKYVWNFAVQVLKRFP